MFKNNRYENKVLEQSKERKEYETQRTYDKRNRKQTILRITGIVLTVSGLLFAIAKHYKLI